MGMNNPQLHKIEQKNIYYMILFPENTETEKNWLPKVKGAEEVFRSICNV